MYTVSVFQFVVICFSAYVKKHFKVSCGHMSPYAFPAKSWLGHVEHIHSHTLVERVYTATVTFFLSTVCVKA